MMEGRIIALEGVEKSYGNFTLGPVNLEIEPGYVVAVVGPNGSGKSTLFRREASRPERRTKYGRTSGRRKRVGRQGDGRAQGRGASGDCDLARVPEAFAGPKSPCRMMRRTRVTGMVPKRSSNERI